jgi:hypothetical protein
MSELLGFACNTCFAFYTLINYIPFRNNEHVPYQFDLAGSHTGSMKLTCNKR